jgi:hypothetical protein
MDYKIMRPFGTSIPRISRHGRLALTSLLLFCVTAVMETASLAEDKSKAWPDPLVLQNGEAVQNAEGFTSKRRPELFNLLAENLYGRTPKTSLKERFEVDSIDEHALHGLAIRKQITLHLGNAPEHLIRILLYLPAKQDHPVGVFVGLNFEGNQTVSADPGIALNTVWIPDPLLNNLHIAKEQSGHVKQIASPETRGKAASQWQLEMILKRGYGLATAYGGDFEPDFDGGFSYGIRPLFFQEKQSIPEANDWGAIGAWAWGMSRIVDYLEQDRNIDSRKIIAFGHSRFGKTALWSAAQDERFTAVISNNSGQAGATLSHRKVGESIDHLILAFPYWFCAQYHWYLGHVDSLPVDGHLVLALIAPRPVYVASGQSDPFSDPVGEFLSAKEASRVYQLFHKEGVSGDLAPLNTPVGATLRYHIRPGGHDVTAYDWQEYLNFADELDTKR